MPIPETRGEHESLRPSLPLVALLWTECPNRWTRRVPWGADEKTRPALGSLQGHDISCQATNCLAISECGPAQWVPFAKTLSARLIDLRSVWGLETLETGTRPGVRVARRRPGGDKILGATQNDPEERCKQPA
jgi:hypothetical protein